MRARACVCVCVGGGSQEPQSIAVPGVVARNKKDVWGSVKAHYGTNFVNISRRQYRGRQSLSKVKLINWTEFYGFCCSALALWHVGGSRKKQQRALKHILNQDSGYFEVESIAKPSKVTEGLNTRFVAKCFCKHFYFNKERWRHNSLAIAFISWSARKHMLMHDGLKMPSQNLISVQGHVIAQVGHFAHQLMCCGKTSTVRTCSRL